MQLKNVIRLTGKIRVQTGLHIGAGDAQMQIGGVDNQVMKHPYTHAPYIPGSSIKGKMRSLLEWYIGVVGITSGAPMSHDKLDKLNGNQRQQAEKIIRLFGSAATIKDEKTAAYFGPTRLSFWDCQVTEAWLEERKTRNQSLTEIKAENVINRISGTAQHPRKTERVPQDARFDFNLTLKLLEDDPKDLIDLVLIGMKLIEAEGLGGATSRGYGKVVFEELKQNEILIMDEFKKINPFAAEKSV